MSLYRFIHIDINIDKDILDIALLSFNNFSLSSRGYVKLHNFIIHISMYLSAKKNCFWLKYQFDMMSKTLYEPYSILKVNYSKSSQTDRIYLVNSVVMWRFRFKRALHKVINFEQGNLLLLEQKLYLWLHFIYLTPGQQDLWVPSPLHWFMPVH